MRCHSSPLARAVGRKPPQTGSERKALGGISEIVFHASTPSLVFIDERTEHEPEQGTEHEGELRTEHESEHEQRTHNTEG
jgi:hypothetical protein